MHTYGQQRPEPWPCSPWFSGCWPAPRRRRFRKRSWLVFGFCRFYRVYRAYGLCTRFWPAPADAASTGKERKKVYRLLSFMCRVYGLYRLYRVYRVYRLFRLYGLCRVYRV